MDASFRTLAWHQPTRPAVIEILLAILATAALCSMGCAHQAPSPQIAKRAHQSQSVQSVVKGGHRDPAAELVVGVLQEQGLRFGTDGSVASLWGYLDRSHKHVSPIQARPGDVLFFQTKPERGQDCDEPDHVGLVLESNGTGRLLFLEKRAGELRKSYVDPELPLVRRDDAGAIHNTFLRPRRVSDPDSAPMFAGEMFCAVVRPQT